MSAFLSLLPPDPNSPIPVIRKIFESIPVFVIRITNGSTWIATVSIKTACEDWGGTMIMVAKTRFFLVQIDGRVQHMEFISYADFLGIVLIRDRYPEFRDFVVTTVEHLEDQGSVLAPDIADDPRMLQIKAITDAMATAIRAERLAQVTAQRQVHLEQSQRQITDTVDTVLDVVDHGKKYVAALVWLAKQGVRVPKEPSYLKSQVGQEIKEIALRLGYDADCRPKEPLGSFFVHHYPLAVMERAGREWMELNRNKPSRRGWFHSV